MFLSFRFSFHDGHISTVCPHENEPVWSLNIKKSILSTFQNRMERFDIHHIVAEVSFLQLSQTFFSQLSKFLYVFYLFLERYKWILPHNLLIFKIQRHTNDSR